MTNQRHPNLFSIVAMLLMLFAPAMIVFASPALAQIGGDPFSAANNVLTSAAQGGKTLVNTMAVLGILGVAIALIFGRGKIPGVWLACVIGAVLLVTLSPMAISWIQSQGGGSFGGLGGFLQ